MATHRRGRHERRSTRPSAGADDTAPEVDGELPEGWHLLRATDACVLVQSGGTPRGRPFTDAGEVPFLKIQNIVDQRVDFSSRRQFIPARVHTGELRRSIVRPGDVLMNIVGPPLGKIAIVPDEYSQWNINQAIVAFRTAKLLLPQFLYYLLCEGAEVRRIESEYRGSAGQVNISLSQARSFLFKVPPLAEQRRIVAKVEELLAHVNAARDHLARVPAILKRFRQSVLAAACSGRLTEEWRQANNGDSRTSLREIGERRRTEWLRAQMERGGKGKSAPPAPPDDEALPEIPTPWSWASADSVCSQITDGEHIQHRYHSVGRPMLTATHVRDGFVAFKDFGLISDSDFKRCLERCAPRTGDILIVSVGATTGRSAIVQREPAFAIVRSVLMLRPLIDPRFLLRWTQSSWCCRWMTEASGASAQPHFYIADAKRMPVPLAPPDEQHEIVRRVDALFALADSIEQRVAAAAARTDRLTQAILAKAFRGELVPTEAELSRQGGRDQEPVPRCDQEHSGVVGRIHGAYERRDGDE